MGLGQQLWLFIAGCVSRLQSTAFTGFLVAQGGTAVLCLHPANWRQSRSVSFSLYLLFHDWKHPSSIESPLRYKSSTASCRDEQCAILHRIASISSRSESNVLNESIESNESQCECVNKSKLELELDLEVKHRNRNRNWSTRNWHTKQAVNQCVHNRVRTGSKSNQLPPTLLLPHSVLEYSNDSQWFVSRYSNSRS